MNEFSLKILEDLHLKLITLNNLQKAN